MSPVKVLDHGFVRLVDSMGGDISVVRAARNSYDAAWRAGANDGDDTKLVHYLWRNKHVSPFEAVTFTFEVQAPIFVLRQWMRHEQSYNEVSGRYTELPELYYTPDPAKIGIQSKSSKQARDMNDDDEEMILLRKIQIDKIKSHNKRSFELYRELINSGWPRELARTQDRKSVV